MHTCFVLVCTKINELRYKIKQFIETNTLTIFIDNIMPYQAQTN